jgi:hypothetical protein
VDNDPAYIESQRSTIRDPAFYLRTTPGTEISALVAAEQLAVFLESTKTGNDPAYCRGIDTSLLIIYPEPETTPGATEVLVWLNTVRASLRSHQGPTTGDARRALRVAIAAVTQAIYTITGISRL